VYYKVKSGDYDIIVHGEGELEAKSAQVLVTPMVRPAPTISYLVDEGTKVKKGDLIAEFTQSEVENDYLNSLDRLENARADSVKTEAELSLQLLTYETQFKTAKASADAARLQLANIEFEAPLTREIKQLEIQQFELEAERARKNLESLKKIQQEERINAQLQIKQAQNDVNRALAQLNQLKLFAPYEGIIVYSISRITDEKIQVGSTLFPRMPVVQIPDLSVIQVKMQITETDAQRLSPGMTAQMTIPSIKNARFAGKVTRVDQIAKPISRGSKVKRVEVVVELDSTSRELRPGLTAIADVFVKRAENVIAAPLETVFENDSMRLVYVKEKSHYEPRPVASLFQDDDFMIIYGDIQEGQLLALREPPNTRVDWPDHLPPVKVPAQADTFKVETKKPPERPPIPPEMMKRMRERGMDVPGRLSPDEIN